MQSAILRLAALVLVLTLVALPTRAQSLSPFIGMWSDPPPTPEGELCTGYCTDVGLNRLAALLDDPKNDSRSFTDLSADATKFERDQYLKPRLTTEALKTFPLAAAEDPGFLNCEPWGVARQIFARHQLEIRRVGIDRFQMRYGEWDAMRTVYLDKRPAPAGPATRMGHSVGRFDGDALVIETTHVAPNWMRYLARHSEQLRIVERYTRAADGKVLNLSATLEDPVMLKEPIVLKKVWSWSPNSKIAAYKDCQLPTGLVSKGR